MKRTGFKPRRLADVIAIHGGGQVIPFPRAPIRPVSKQRARENRQRAAMADRLWPGRHDGTVLCTGRPGCTQRAEDLHEPRFRSRGGGITDPDGCRPLCRSCHDWVHAHPAEAETLGLAISSWDNNGGDVAL